MDLAWKIFAGLAGVLHLLFFLMESILFKRPDVQQRFGLSPEEAKAAGIWAFNQGFYNLFLAAGLFTGIILAHTAYDREGLALVVFVCATMVGAGLVLAFSEPKLVSAACVVAAMMLVGMNRFWPFMLSIVVATIVGNLLGPLLYRRLFRSSSGGPPEKQQQDGKK